MIEEFQQLNEKILENVKRRNISAIIPPFDNVIVRCDRTSYESSIDELLININAQKDVSEYPDSFGSGVKAILKKIIVKLVRFYVLPVVCQQNMFNESVSTVLKMQSEQIEDMNETIMQLENLVKKKTIELDELRGTLLED